jgi:hypothetical protein
MFFFEVSPSSLAKAALYSSSLASMCCDVQFVEVEIIFLEFWALSLVLSPATRLPPMSSKCEASFTVVRKTRNGFGLSFKIGNGIASEKASPKPHKFNITTAFFLEF